CLAERSAWPSLLAGSFLVAVAWIVSLATVDGLPGISRVYENPAEYLGPAKAVTDVGAMLRGFVDRIPLTAPDHWPVHVAGHPPGALLVFVLLVRIGLGNGLASGLVSIGIAATAPVAVLICLRRLGAEPAARRAAPILVLAPAAVWIGVTADAAFGAIAAWGLCCLAVAATSPRRSRGALVAVAAGLLLGFSVFLSYGMPLLGLLAIAILLAARSFRVLPVAVLAAVAVAAAFAAAGFAWWEAYPVLVDRYWAGVATRRPGLYWIWADLAVLAISAGPIVGAGVAASFARLRTVEGTSGDCAVVLLTLAAAGMVVAADLSMLSRSEVERIWQPFVPWLLVGTALLSARWRRSGLAAGALTALVVEHLLHTAW
ncbi:hypothetical protein, partial [uncultured Amnibacterium sp.]|uniref:hypothetical protein n=1 Tax=uncultured Amnibacterium sp. TaxID=1631851 RepID=UPI0035CA0466